MKALKILLICLTTSFSIISCNDDPVEQPKGGATFSFISSDINGRMDESQIDYIIVTIEDENGNVVYEDEVIPVNQFDAEFESDPISLSIGNHTLTKFLVAGSDEIVHFATPLEGSDLAYLVSDPLPIHFTVEKDIITRVKPEVVSTDDGTVEDFGYGEFSFKIIELFDLLVGVFDYNSAEGAYEMIEAPLTVFGESDSLFTIDLFSATNKVAIPDTYLTYSLRVDKAGYEEYYYQFSSDSIKQFQGIGPNGPLEIILEKAVNLDNGLVAYYPFDGNATDQTGNGFDGIVSGVSLGTDRFNSTDSAYYFDGINDYIDLGDSVMNDVRTISLWFKPSETIDNTLSDFKPLIARNNDFNPTNNGNEFSIAFAPNNVYNHAESGGRISFVIRDEDGSGDLLLSESNSWNAGEWYHILVKFEAGSPSMFINGDLQEYEFQVDDNNLNAIPALDRITTLGSWGDLFSDVDRYFKGAIDDVRIYDRALQEDEVQYLSSN